MHLNVPNTSRKSTLYIERINKKKTGNLNFRSHHFLKIQDSSSPLLLDVTSLKKEEKKKNLGLIIGNPFTFYVSVELAFL